MCTGDCSHRAGIPGNLRYDRLHLRPILMFVRLLSSTLILRETTLICVLCLDHLHITRFLYSISEMEETVASPSLIASAGGCSVWPPPGGAPQREGRLPGRAYCRRLAPRSPERTPATLPTVSPVTPNCVAPDITNTVRVAYFFLDRKKHSTTLPWIGLSDLTVRIVFICNTDKGTFLSVNLGS